MHPRHFLTLPFILALLLLTLSPLAADEGFRGPWGDQGDGTFRNPVLPADYSDPDVIRVGSDYYLISSTFQYSPGMALLHSKDLVNWRIIGHCVDDLTQIGPDLNWNRMNRYNRGIWAGALRHHAGRFWMFFTTIDEGVFMTTATNPAGPWAPLHRIWDVKGWDDPCPLWDDDGQAYLLLSKPGKEWWTHLFKMSPDGKTLDLASDQVVDRHHGSEGNKLYKFKDTYYIFHNQIDGPGNRTGVFMRSKSLAGPWEKKLFLYGSGPQRDREPNQGGLIETPDGKWWFLTHHGRGGFYDGRPLSLLPVRWEDGWPVVATPPAAADPKSVMVWRHAKPVANQPITVPQTDDDFAGAVLPPQWEWNYQPRREKWSLTERPGFLRLHAFKPLQPGNLKKAGNTLTQRVGSTGGGEVTVRLEVNHMADGQTAGLCFFWKEFATLGAVQSGGGKRRVEFNRNGTVTAGPDLPGPSLWCRATIDANGNSTFAYSLDGQTFVPIGEPFAFGWHDYRGTRVGLFSYNDQAEAGFVDVDWFRYAYAGPHSAPKR